MYKQSAPASIPSRKTSNPEKQPAQTNKVILVKVGGGGGGGQGEAKTFRRDPYYKLLVIMLSHLSSTMSTSGLVCTQVM